MTKTSIIASVSLLVFSTLADAPASSIKATATFKDGSTIKGTFVSEGFSGNTLFADQLKLKPELVRTIKFKGDDGVALITLRNEDSFSMKLTDSSYRFDSMLGTLDLPLNNLRTLQLTASSSANNHPSTDGLVYACSFDKGISNPEVGPAGTLELGMIIPDGGKTGGALFVRPGVAGAQITFPEGSLGDNGCIEFWAKLQSGKTEFSTGGDPRFFLLSTADGNEICHFEYASNDGCGHCGLTAQVTGVRAFSHQGLRGMMPYSDIFNGEDFNGWHHYALSWTAETVTIYLDGQELCRGYGIVNGELMAKSLILDIPLNRTRGKSYNNKSAFLMDDLKIWNRAKTEFGVKP